MCSISVPLFPLHGTRVNNKIRITVILDGEDRYSMLIMFITLYNNDPRCSVLEQNKACTYTRVSVSVKCIKVNIYKL
jgi:hypothetical protein